MIICKSFKMKIHRIYIKNKLEILVYQEILRQNLFM
jgi:hypothetical protein